VISRFLSEGVRRWLGGAKPKAPTPTYELLDQPGQLTPLLAAIDGVDEVCLDTEADNMHRYRTRVCLLQFLVKDRVFLVDALAPLNFDPLWERLAQKHLVMHGSDYDLRLLHDLCGFEARSIFDTMLAAQLINRKRVGLAALLEDYFGVTLSKDSQKANWSKRPLTKKLLDYAAMDVWHLPELRDLLTRELVKLDRADWLEQQCRRQIESARIGFPRDDELAWRIGKSERLRGVGLGVLHAVWHWREEQAERLDTPPFKVCNNDLLLRIAFAAEEGESEATIMSQVNLGRRHPRLAPSLAAAIRDGLARDPQTLPRRKRNSENQPLSTEELTLQDRLKADRDVLAVKLELDPTLIANRAQLAQVARAPDRIHEILLPWQAELIRGLPSFSNGTRPN
jgi:ribonuclease D